MEAEAAGYGKDLHAFHCSHEKIIIPLLLLSSSKEIITLDLGDRGCCSGSNPAPPWTTLLKAMPTCVLAKSPQAFAIPVSGKFDHRKPAEYLEKLVPLCCGAKELTKVAY